MRKSIHTAQYRLFCELLVEVRQSAGVTQQQLARRMRMTQSAVSKVERGERRLDVVELHAWTRALAIPFRTFAAELDGRLNK
jgi:transcriptional regulator with XRE-family HTH domain